MRAMGYRGMGHMGNGAYGQWGHRGQWGTGHMCNDTHRGKVVQGVWVQGYGAHTWAMGHMGDVAQGTMGYRGIGYRRYGLQGVWGT